MKVNFQNDAYESNISNQTTFKIEANAVMFKMLSADIYSNKIRAVIRELSTNAIDAMKDSGTLDTMKYDVHLPTYLEPHFSIRDYGTGLDDKGIKAVYTYGASTRRNSNDFVGAFGIGSKSPFAYSESGFIITSYFNGVVTTYSAYAINGIPNISKVGEKSTKELNGLKIEINVDSNDINKFEREANYVYAWLEHKPNLGEGFDAPVATIEIETPTYIKPTNSTEGHILMGGILYEIPYALRSRLHYTQSNFLDSHIIKAELGDFALQPSRESIDSTDENEKKLMEFMSGLEDELLKKYISIGKKSIEKNEPPFLTLQYLMNLYESINRFIKENQRELLQKYTPQLYTSLTEMESFIDNQFLPVIELGWRNKYVSFERLLKIGHRLIIFDTFAYTYAEIKVQIDGDGGYYAILKPKLSNYKQANGRYDYDKFRTDMTLKMKDVFGLGEDEFDFISKIMPKKIKEVKIKTPKIKKEKMIKTFNCEGGSGSCSFDVKNPPYTVYYVRSNYVADQEYLHNGIKINNQIVGRMARVFRSLMNEHQIDESYVVIIAPKTQISDNVLKHEAYKPLYDSLKQLYSTTQFLDYSELETWLYSEYNNNIRWGRFIKDLRDVSFKSKFLKTIYQHENNILYDIKCGTNKLDISKYTLPVSLGIKPKIKKIKLDKNLKVLDGLGDIKGKLLKLISTYSFIDKKNVAVIDSIFAHVERNAKKWAELLVASE